jgi:hypothetical protein
MGVPIPAGEQSERPAIAARGTKDSSLSFALCAGALVLLHLVLANHFLSFASVFSAEPFTGDDYDTHIGQAYRVIEGLERYGKSWVYDVQLLAGQPEGTIFDADNKGWAMWTYVLYRLGMAKGMAFNTYVLLAHLGAPLAGFIAARWLSIGRFASLLAALLCSLLWFFDSFTHWAWWIGMVAYASASYFTLLPLACFYRFTCERKLRHAIGSALLLGVAHLNHPYSFFVLAPALGASYLAQARTFSRRDHVCVLAIAAFTLAMNGFWLHAAFIHWHYILDSAYFGQTGFAYLVADFFGILLNPSDSGVIGTRAAFRFACMGLALCALIAFRKQRDPRLPLFAATLSFLFVLAYMGAYVPHAGQIQPYRHVIPLGFVSALAGAAFVEHAARSGAFAALAGSPTLLSITLVLALLGVQLLGRDALYFVPEAMKPVDPLIDGSTSPIAEHGYGRFHPELAHVSYRTPRGRLFEMGARNVVKWFEKNVALGERVLVDAPSFGERLAWRGKVEVLGGFRERNIGHAYANFFRLYPAPVEQRKVQAYLSTYAVRWVLLHHARPDLEESPFLERLPDVEGRRIFRSRVNTNKVLSGGGRVRGSTNKIEVWGSDDKRDVTLSYHFHEALGCQPACRVERAANAISRVGFIRVPAPHPADFVIWNRYP